MRKQLKELHCRGEAERSEKEEMGRLYKELLEQLRASAEEKEHLQVTILCPACALVESLFAYYKRLLCCPCVPCFLFQRCGSQNSAQTKYQGAGDNNCSSIYHVEVASHCKTRRLQSVQIVFPPVYLPKSRSPGDSGPMDTCALQYISSTPRHKKLRT